MKYLIKMTPLEPFAFGTDQGFKYPDEKGTGKESYFVRSREIPEQTTILGMLRYLILSDRNLLKTNFEYTSEEREKMAEVIGPASFSFASEEKQDFGYIKKISPVFLVDEVGNKYIKNPFHNKSREKGYEPVQMEAEEVETSVGPIRLPKRDEYDAKKGHGSGYFNLQTREIVGDLFGTQVVTGNRKNGAQEKNKDGFFKRELHTLKKGFSFAVYAEVEELPESTIVYMGQKKSAFQITVAEAAVADLENEVKAAFADCADTWIYALSDLLVKDKKAYRHFCMVEEKTVRNLETVYSEKAHHKKVKKSMVRYSMVSSGSVFFEQCDIDATNENWEQIGYNKLVQLGGN